MLVQPAAAGCPDTGCLVDLNERCPDELRADGGRACRSACEAFGSPEYCCNGAYGNPNTCHPSQYSQLFKSACPKSYSYAYDDAIHLHMQPHRLHHHLLTQINSIQVLLTASCPNQILPSSSTITLSFSFS
jgi:hypothetical protein